MKFYKSIDGGIFAFEDDGSQDYLISQSMVKLSADEVDSHISQNHKVILKTQFTSLEFLDRFTDSEQLTVVSATMSNPVIKLWYDRLLAASFISLDDPRTEAGIDALITAELIAPERKEALLQPE